MHKYFVNICFSKCLTVYGMLYWGLVESHLHALIIYQLRCGEWLEFSREKEEANRIYLFICLSVYLDSFPDGSGGKTSACHVGDMSLIPGSGRYPGEGNGSPLQCCCLVNSCMERGAWWATVHGVAKTDMTEQLTHTHTHTCLCERAGGHWNLL